MDDEIRILAQFKTDEEFEALLRSDPWEGVIYLAGIGEDERARELKDRLLEATRLQETRLRQALEAGALTDGVLIAGPDAKGRCIIGVGGTRYDVEIMPDLTSDLDKLQPGREVWVDPKTMAIQELRDSYVQGEAAPIVQVLTTDASQETEAAHNPDHPPSDNPTQKVLRLKVKSRQEEIVVEAVPTLADLGPHAGDTVRIIGQLGVALELLERGRNDVLLGEVPTVKYHDIGGLDVEMTKIRDAIEEPYVHPHVFERYHLQRPNGILLYGPPGCGKTMIAKAIANSLSRRIEQSLHEVKTALACYITLVSRDEEDNLAKTYDQWRKSLGHAGEEETLEPDCLLFNPEDLRLRLETFLRSRGVSLQKAAEEEKKIAAAIQQGSRSYFVSIKGPELLSKWVGETESSIRSIFAMARERATAHTPVVLFFDELESMFSRRGSGISSDVQKTIVPQLLAEIDGIEETRNVIVIGASNRFDLIDPAVLRPGRLDFKIEIPRPNREAAHSILSRYLTPDIPFPPGELHISAEMRAVLGDASTNAAALTDCLSIALDEFCDLLPGLRGAVLTTDSYRTGAPEPADLHLHAASGFAPDTRDAIIEAWGAEGGPASRVLRSGHADMSQRDPAVNGGARYVSAWPVNAPLSPELTWGVLVVGHQSRDLPQTLTARASFLAPAIAAAIQARRETAERLANRMLDLVYHDRSRLVIIEKIERQRAIRQFKREPLTAEKKISEIMTGAILANIVARAKRRAVKREIRERSFGLTGVGWDDIREAIEIECREGKDQYIFELSGDDPYGRGQAYHDVDRFQVEILLPQEHEDLGRQSSWLTSKSFAWRRPDPTRAARADGRRP